MRTGNEARLRQRNSLKEENEKLEQGIAQKKRELAELTQLEQKAPALISEWNQKIDDAKRHHAAVIASHDGEIALKQMEIALKQMEKDILTRKCEEVEAWYLDEASTKSEELNTLDTSVEKKKDELQQVIDTITSNRETLRQLVEDRSEILKSVAKALEESAVARRTLEEITNRIDLANQQETQEDEERRKKRDSFDGWEKRLNVREHDLNILAARIEPEFIKAFGESKLNASVFRPSTP